MIGNFLFLSNFNTTNSNDKRKKTGFSFNNTHTHTDWLFDFIHTRYALKGYWSHGHVCMSHTDIKDKKNMTWHWHDHHSYLIYIYGSSDQWWW